MERSEAKDLMQDAINKIERKYNMFLRQYDIEASMSEVIVPEVFVKQLKEYCGVRYKAYKALLDKMSDVINSIPLDKRLIREFFKQIHEGMDLILDELTDICKRNFFSINKMSLRLLVQDINEQHREYLNYIKILEKEFKKKVM